jgi:hypothetical protein
VLIRGHDWFLHAFSASVPSDELRFLKKAVLLWQDPAVKYVSWVRADFRERSGKNQRRISVMKSILVVVLSIFNAVVVLSWLFLHPRRRVLGKLMVSALRLGPSPTSGEQT